MFNCFLVLEIICSDRKYISCNINEQIRVHDVIYGHVVGRNECGTQPTTNCTASNGFCEVAERAEGGISSQWLQPSKTITPPPCEGTDIYIIINYSCMKELTLSGKVFVYIINSYSPKPK